MPASDLVKVVWGAPSFWIERFPLYCGRHFGFFRDLGIELDIWYSYGGPELAKAVTRGDIHIGDMGLPPFITAYVEGLPAKIIGSSPIQQLDHYLVGVSPINHMNDLAGKRVGILSHGSCDDYFLSRLLRAQGIDPKQEVEQVALGSRYGDPRVFTDGTVDAGFMVEPGVAAGESSGLFKVIGRVGDYFPRYQWGVILASNEWLTERRELVERLLAAFRNACRWIHANPEETIELGCDVFNVDKTVFRRALYRDLSRWRIDARINFAGVHNAVKIQESLGVAIDGINLSQMIEQM